MESEGALSAVAFAAFHLRSLSPFVSPFLFSPPHRDPASSVFALKCNGEKLCLSGCAL